MFHHKIFLELSANSKMVLKVPIFHFSKKKLDRPNTGTGTAKHGIQSAELATVLFDPPYSELNPGLLVENCFLWLPLLSLSSLYAVLIIIVFTFILSIFKEAFSEEVLAFLFSILVGSNVNAAFLVERLYFC